MRAKKRYAFYSFMIFFTVSVLHAAVSMQIRVGKAVPVVILPLLTAYAMFSPVIPAAFAGLLAGWFMDGTAGGAFCLNALILMLIAALISALSEYLFHKNIRSAAVLCLLVTVLYFLTKWAVLYALGANAEDSLTYLLYYGIPSMIYTEGFIFLFFPLYRRFNRLKGD